jgi:hypothetical protein
LGLEGHSPQRASGREIKNPRCPVEAFGVKRAHKAGAWGARDVKKYYSKFDVAVVAQMP